MFLLKVTHGNIYILLCAYCTHGITLYLKMFAVEKTMLLKVKKGPKNAAITFVNTILLVSF